MFVPFFMAGRESHASNPLLDDFVLLGHKLIKLGFIYDRGSVLILRDSMDETVDIR